MKKIVCVVLLVILITSMLYSTFYILPVNAQGTIYIRADGSIDPPSALISTLDNVTYTFAGNISSDASGIVVERDNIVIDGAGHTLQETKASLSRGIDLTARTNVTVENTQIKNFSCGIWLNQSSDNIISGNEMTNNGYGVSIQYSSNHNYITGNNMTANSQYCVSIQIGSDNNWITGNNMTANSGCVSIAFNCVSNYVLWNDMTNNGGGIGISISNSNQIYGNRITNNTGGGVVLYYGTHGNRVDGNNLTANGYGVKVIGSLSPPYPTDNNFIDGNDIVDNTIGVWLEYTSRNSICENNIAGNGNVGIKVVISSYENMIFSNFLNISQQVLVDASSYSNLWDWGYSTGGNCWSDYSGTDIYSGLFQDETGSDGLGDTPYVIDAANQDDYPLMKPFGGYNDVGITDIATSREVVGQGHSVSLAVTLLNYGIYSTTENVSVSVCANATVIASQNVTLGMRNSTTLTFILNTSGFARAYTIGAVVAPLEGEIDLTDNTLVNGIIKVSCLGDINGDYVTDSKDYVLVKKAIPSFPGSPKWNPNADMNDDTVVDAKDYQLVKNNIPSIFP